MALRNLILTKQKTAIRKRKNKELIVYTPKNTLKINPSQKEIQKRSLEGIGKLFPQKTNKNSNKPSKK